MRQYRKTNVVTSSPNCGMHQDMTIIIIDILAFGSELNKKAVGLMAQLSAGRHPSELNALES